jgi:ABC-type phosphate/phosphonate transport system substrate-binding protein
MKKLLFVALSVFLLSACAEKEYSIGDFKDDEKLRLSFLAKCNQGEIDPKSVNCLNAYRADDFIISTKEAEGLKRLVE